MSTLALINKLKEADQDFEWYPTTTEILNKLIDNVRRYVANEFDKKNDWREKNIHSVMDIGAGNGKVLRALGAAPREMAREDRGKLMSEFYAIEKSPILCQQLDPNIFIVGTDFMAQELMSKQVGMIFCNPPYKQFAEWSIKIIREAAASVVYLSNPAAVAGEHRHRERPQVQRRGGGDLDGNRAVRRPVRVLAERADAGCAAIGVEARVRRVPEDAVRVENRCRSSRPGFPEPRR